MPVGIKIDSNNKRVYMISSLPPPLPRPLWRTQCISLPYFFKKNFISWAGGFFFFLFFCYFYRFFHNPGDVLSFQWSSSISQKKQNARITNEKWIILLL